MGESALIQPLLEDGQTFLSSTHRSGIPRNPVLRNGRAFEPPPVPISVYRAQQPLSHLRTTGVVDAREQDSLPAHAFSPLSGGPPDRSLFLCRMRSISSCALRFASRCFSSSGSQYGWSIFHVIVPLIGGSGYAPTS